MVVLSTAVAGSQKERFNETHGINAFQNCPPVGQMRGAFIDFSRFQARTWDRMAEWVSAPTLRGGGQ